MENEIKIIIVEDLELISSTIRAEILKKHPHAEIISVGDAIGRNLIFERDNSVKSLVENMNKIIHEMKFKDASKVFLSETKDYKYPHPNTKEHYKTSNRFYNKRYGK